jgi:hypothetical protein
MSAAWCVGVIGVAEGVDPSSLSKRGGGEIARAGAGEISAQWHAPSVKPPAHLIFRRVTEIGVVKNNSMRAPDFKKLRALQPNRFLYRCS